MAKLTTKKQELRKLKKIFDNLPEDTRKVCEGVIEDCAFQREQLCILQKDIEEKGYTEEYQNGKEQWGIKKRAEVEIYSTVSKQYLANVKFLVEQLPDKKVDIDPLLDYIAR